MNWPRSHTACWSFLASVNATSHTTGCRISSCLAVLNLSHNSLQSMPLGVMPPSICTHDISHNQFRTVPLCICSFTSLVSLDLSYNHDICMLPAEMGRLSSLERLHLRGLKGLKESTRRCICYLNQKLGCVPEWNQFGRKLFKLFLYQMCDNPGNYVVFPSSRDILVL